MKLITAALLIISSCSKAQSETRSRIINGTLGRQCNGIVAVKCSAKLGELCGSVRNGVDFWNRQLAGRTFFRYDGMYTGSPVFAPGILYVLPAPDGLEPAFVNELNEAHIVGFSPSEATPESRACFTESATFIMPRLLEFKSVLQETVIVHEMGHILGLPHNVWDSDSVMSTPAEATPLPMQLTQADKATLWAIYGNL